jgi:acyl-CoA synthetase (AMP-forming)/AMP-acid ligase II
MRVNQLLGESAARFDGVAAVVAGGVSHSFAELDQKADRLAAAMRDRGVTLGDRVVVFMEDCFATVVSIFAVFKAGGVLTPVDPATRADKLAYVLDHSRAVGIVTQARLASVAAAAVVAAPLVELVVLVGGDWTPPSESCIRFEDIVARGRAVPTFDGPADCDAPGLLAYAPSTGEPSEPASVTHRQIDRAVEAAGAAIGEGGDRALLVQSASSVPGIYRLLAAVKLGATVVLDDRGEHATKWVLPAASIAGLDAAPATG